MKHNFNSGDIFILFFDHVESIGHSLVIDILLNIQEECLQKRVVFRYTTYYCFEELFLSYTGLFNLIKVDDDTYKEVKVIQENIISGKNYFRNDISFWTKKVQHRQGVLKTREKLSSYICNDLLNTSNGDFKLSKDFIGSCWITDCCNTYLHKDVCAKCDYIKKESTFKDKLEDFEKKSVSKLSLPFSTIFNNVV